MKFKHLKLYTSQLNSEKVFYTQTLGLPLLTESQGAFTVQVGWSSLTFQASEKPHQYHYCFLIPSNKLEEAMTWIDQRTPVLIDKQGVKIHDFVSWNAKAFYFYDASGSIAECIVRYDLNYTTQAPFDASQLLCVNEIGLPTQDIGKTNQFLYEQLGTQLWRGDFEWFGVHGSQEALFLLPNYLLKPNWYPLDRAITLEPFTAIVETQEKLYEVSFNQEELLKVSPFE